MADKPAAGLDNQVKQDAMSYEKLAGSSLKTRSCDTQYCVFSHPNILRPEQELTVQVGSFYEVHICNSDVSFFSCTKPDEGKVFEKLTANGTSSNLDIGHRVYQNRGGG